MKTRNLLAVSHLDEFKRWLIKEGWELHDAKGYYEVLRATKTGRRHPLIVYKRLSTNAGGELVHLTVLDRDCGVVRAFIKNKENKNDA